MSHPSRPKCITCALLIAICACALAYGAEKQPKPAAVDSAADAKIAAGKAYLAGGMYEKAEREFNEAITIDTCSAQAYLLAALAIRKGKKPDPKKAVSLLEKAVRIAPDDAGVHLELAQAYAEKGAQTLAEREFESAINLSRDDAILVSAHLGLMAIYEKKGDVEKAEKEYETAKTIFPGVDEMIKQAEIARLSPSPVYAGGGASQEGSYHPFLEDRIKDAEEAIDKTEGGTR